MTFTRIYCILLLTGSLLLFPAGAATPTSITINPVVTDADTAFTGTLPNKKFYLQPMVDATANSEKGVAVGQTRLRRKTMGPILCSPPPASVVYSSFETFFKRKNILALSKESADYLVDIEVLAFTLTETAKTFTQTINSLVTIKVTITSVTSSSAPVVFTLSTQNSYTTLDTSKHAEKVLRGALRDALLQAAKNLTSL